MDNDIVTGDLVTADSLAPGLSRLPRRSLLRRYRHGQGEQPLVANIDTVFLTVSAHEADRPSLLERLAVIGWDSGAMPVIVVTKSDLLSRGERDTVTSAIIESCPGVEHIFTSTRTPDGMNDLRSRLSTYTIAAFVGHSGVGKSSLVNALAPSHMLDVGDVRDRDSKGRHTTTSRQLIPVLDGRSLVIDTPGLREFGVPADADSSADVFPEIEALTVNCRFADCKHRHDAGCAVTKARDEGQVDRGRVRRFLALREEAAVGAPHQLRRDKNTEHARLAREVRAMRGH